MTQEEFKDWLDDDDKQSVSFNDNEYAYTFIKVYVQNGLSYLYCQTRQVNAHDYRINNYHYSGIYNSNDGIIYDVNPRMKRLYPEMIDTNTPYDMANKVELKVWELVDKMLDNDPSNLTIQALPLAVEDEMKRKAPYTASGMARQLFIFRKPIDDFTFACDFRKGQLTEEELLDYIYDPAELTERLAREYFDNNQEKMLWFFKTRDEVQKALERMESLPPDHQIKRIRDLITAVSSVPAKTVTATINWRDESLTLKMDADTLRQDCFGGYNVNCISEKDRPIFRAHYGQFGGFYPEDITEIRYGKKVLYQAATDEPVQAEGEEITLKM